MIQHQRQLIHTFQKISALRIQSEAQAKASFEQELQAVNAEREEAIQLVNKGLSEASKAEKKALPYLQNLNSKLGKRTQTLYQENLSSFTPPNSNARIELEQNINQLPIIVSKIESGIEDAKSWHRKETERGKAFIVFFILFLFLLFSSSIVFYGWLV